MSSCLVSHSLVRRMTGVLFAAGFLLTLPDLSVAQDLTMPGKSLPGDSSCSCPRSDDEKPKLWPKPKFADLKPNLTGKDEIAALEAVHLALSEVGDGSSYVWHQKNGPLSGVVQPTSTFRDSGGKICRHLVLALSAEGYARTTEGVACRLANGAWQLEG